MEREFYKTYFRIERDHWWFRVRRNIIFWLVEKYGQKIIQNVKNVGNDGHVGNVRNVRTDGNEQFEQAEPRQTRRSDPSFRTTPTIHDFGCGSGYLVGELQERGYNASGSDTSKKAIEFGRQRGIRNLQAVDSDEMPQNGPYDAILALDVIEHIKDDIGAIRGLESALKPGGTLIVTIPAYQWLWGVQDEVAHHFRRYDMKSAAGLVKNSAGLSLIRKSYFNTFLFLPIAVVRLASKLFKIKHRESDFDISSNFLNLIFYGIFNIEAKFLKYINFPFGVSILLILKKQ